MSEPMNNKGTSRREFLTTAAAAGAAVAVGLNWAQNVHAAGDDEIKVGIIGCGGRGTQAGENVLAAAPGVKVVAIGDVFQNRLDGGKNALTKFVAKDEDAKKHGNKVDLGDRIFIGLDAYKRVLDSDINYVILATPPGFRPIHLEAAVNKGVTIFTEKPVGTDTNGIRKVFAAYEKAKEKNLGIAAGTQRRHQTPYLEVIKRIKDGEIGEVLGGTCHWNQDILWQRDRQPGWSDATYQIHNWYNFVWTCGDHIVEQHVHNIDVINWILGSPPVAALGFGYKTRNDPRYHNIYDFFSVDLEYPGGVHVQSTCRQISDCANRVAEYVRGTKGNAYLSANEKNWMINGKKVYTREQIDGHANPYVQEHTDLIESVRKGQPINELKNVAESTLTAIMGRMSAYSGKQVSWDFVKNTSKEDLFPKDLAWESSLPEPALPIPGKYKLV